MKERPKTAYEAWVDFVWASRGFLHEYSPEALILFGFVLGLGVAAIMLVMM